VRSTLWMLLAALQGCGPGSTERSSAVIEEIKTAGGRIRPYLNPGAPQEVADPGQISIFLQGPGITDDLVLKLKDVDGLRAVGFSETPAVTRKGLAGLPSISGLRDLALHGSNFGDEALGVLKDLKNLKMLLLSEVVVSDRVFQGVAGATGLQFLTLNEMRGLTDAGLRAIAGLKALKHLQVESCNTITKEGPRHLAGLEGLEVLSFSRTRIGDDGAAHLASLKRLKILFLDRSRITDAGLRHLKDLQALERLGISENKITDAGLDFLKGLRALRDLNVNFTDVTRKGLDALKAGLPKLSVNGPSGSSPAD